MRVLILWVLYWGKNMYFVVWALEFMQSLETFAITRAEAASGSSQATG